jgi:CheY-like chemotaxis protein
VIHEIPGKTLVVLEDNEEILNSLTKLLASWGADIISATSFNASLMKRLGVRRHVDLIVADQNLGNSISGVEAAFRIRELVGRPVPVVMLTAVQAPDVIAEFQQVMQQRLARNPHLAQAIAASRVEEPIVLQKPTTAAVLNKTLVEVLARGAPKPASAFALDTPAVAEGSEDRVG